jgi:phage baseplate assembly protein W
MPSEIAVPFRVDLNGRVVATTNPDAQVRLHVLALLNTTPVERAMVPGYGTDLVGLLFGDPDGDEIASQASIRVRNAMQEHEPGVDLIRAVPDNQDSEGNFAVVDVEYRRLDAPDATVTAAMANQAIIGANGVVREIVRG